MLKKASMFLPGLKTEGGRQWMGYRPSLPIPCQLSAAHPQVAIFTMVSAMVIWVSHNRQRQGRIICDLITGFAPVINIEPFKPQRFRN
jgi:D-amino-acid dehydrogenase